MRVNFSGTFVNQYSSVNKLVKDLKEFTTLGKYENIGVFIQQAEFSSNISGNFYFDDTHTMIPHQTYTERHSYLSKEDEAFFITYKKDNIPTKYFKTKLYMKYLGLRLPCCSKVFNKILEFID